MVSSLSATRQNSAMPQKEASARIKINKLLESAGWHFFDDANGPANISLEPNVKITQQQVDAMGDDFQTSSNGFIDFLLLDDKGFPLVVLEAKAESKNPLIGNPALVGRSVLVPSTTERITFSGFTIRCRFVADVEPKFYACLFKSALHRELFKDAGQGAGIRNLSQAMFRKIKVPLPAITVQRAFVAEIEAEQALVNANRELIVRMQAKIKATIDRVWGDVAQII